MSRPTMADPPARTPGVDSARRALQVLMMFTSRRPTLTADEIAREIGISLPTAYRFLSLLRELQLVTAGDGGAFRLSPRVSVLARAAEEGLDLRAETSPMVADLAAATGEAALVVRRAGDYAATVVMEQTEQPIQLSFRPGHVMPLHRGAAPKILLAAMPRSWVARYLDRLSPTLSPSGRDDLLEELDRIEARGSAESSAEVDEGVWAVAAPIRLAGRVVAAVTVAGPAFRIDADRADAIRQRVRSGAEDVSALLDRWSDD